MYFATVISIPNFIVGIYTALLFLPAFVYKDNALLHVSAFFKLVWLSWKYHVLLGFTQEDFHMVRQVREIGESEWTFFSVSQI